MKFQDGAGRGDEVRMVEWGGLVDCSQINLRFECAEVDRDIAEHSVSVGVVNEDRSED